MRIADDQKLLRRLLGTQLRKIFTSLEVVEATTGEEALAALSASFDGTTEGTFDPRLKHSAHPPAPHALPDGHGLQSPGLARLVTLDHVPALHGSGADAPVVQ